MSSPPSPSDSESFLLFPVKKVLVLPELKFEKLNKGVLPNKVELVERFPKSDLLSSGLLLENKVLLAKRLELPVFANNLVSVLLKSPKRPPFFSGAPKRLLGSDDEVLTSFLVNSSFVLLLLESSYIDLYYKI